MNLNSIVGGVVASINPQVPVVWKKSDGYKKGLDGTRTAYLLDPQTIMVQVQPLSMQALQHLDGLNIQGTLRAVYLTGEAAGAVRATRTGGDVFEFADPMGGSEVFSWLAVYVLETWPEWCKVVVQLQRGLST